MNLNRFDFSDDGGGRPLLIKSLASSLDNRMRFEESCAFSPNCYFDIYLWHIVGLRQASYRFIGCFI